MWQILVPLLLIVAGTPNPARASDFALMADLENGTIYAGTMGQRLDDAAPLPLSGVMRPVAVDYDPVEKMVYWTDLHSRPTASISRAHIDGSNQMKVKENLRLPDGLALDVEARLMFWTDGVLGHVARASMDGPGETEILVIANDMPRAIVTDHKRRHIYWTDWGDSPRIERSNYDGTDRRTIIEDDLIWPNGVFITESKLYWCDAGLDTLERSDLSGSNREMIVNLSGVLEVLHPFDLSVYNEDVYWTDWALSVVIRIHTSGRGVEVFSPALFERAGGLHIQKEPSFCDSSPCSNAETCLDAINGFSCLCPPDSLPCAQNVDGPDARDHGDGGKGAGDDGHGGDSDAGDGDDNGKAGGDDGHGGEADVLVGDGGKGGGGDDGHGGEADVHVGDGRKGGGGDDGHGGEADVHVDDGGKGGAGGDNGLGGEADHVHDRDGGASGGKGGGDSNHGDRGNGGSEGRSGLRVLPIVSGAGLAALAIVLAVVIIVFKRHRTRTRNMDVGMVVLEDGSKDSYWSGNRHQRRTYERHIVPVYQDVII